MMVFCLTILEAPDAKAEILTFPCGGSATYSVSVPEGILSDGKNCLGDVVININVKTIGQEAFYMSGITSVLIPDSVTGISREAFVGTKITSVVIPDSVLAIGEAAFFGVPLKTVVIGKSVTIVGGKAFAANSHLNSISIPDGLKILGPYALPITDSLHSVTYCGKLTGFPITPTCPPERKKILDNENEGATFSGCPSTWKLKLPAIQIEASSSNPRVKRITYLGDNRNIVNFESHLMNYYPEVSGYIDSLGQEAKANISIEVSDRQNFSEKISDSDHLLRIWFSWRAAANYFDAEYGVPIDPWVRLNLKIEVKGCKPLSLNSNAVQYRGNYPLENIEDYFSSGAGNAFYDSKQQELLRNALKKNFEELSNPEVLRRLLFGGENKSGYYWQTANDSNLNSQTDVRLVALSPLNCLKGTGRFVAFTSTPCKIGVFLSDWDSGEHLVQIIDVKQKMNPYKIITCTKGKLTKKINSAAINPTCPVGWKKS